MKRIEVVKNLAKIDTVLAVAKIGTKLICPVKLLGFAIPQYAIAMMFMPLAIPLLIPKKEQKKVPQIPSKTRV
jgi:hypothetical protein